MCVFCQIVAGKLSADIVHEDEQCLVIRDIHPQAPVHFLVMPKKHLPSLAQMEEDDQSLLGHLMWVASEVARKNGVEQGFRLLANNGRAVGQSVFHLHFHLLAGKRYAEAGL